MTSLDSIVTASKTDDYKKVNKEKNADKFCAGVLQLSSPERPKRVTFQPRVVFEVFSIVFFMTYRCESVLLISHQ